MRKTAAIVLGLAVATVVAASPARHPVTLDQLKTQAAADAATPDGRAYLKQFFTNPWMLAMDAADERCRSVFLASESPQDFVIALSMGSNGYPLGVLVSPDNQGMRCMAEKLRATPLLAPPHDGFAIYMPFEAVEPGSERELAIRATAEASK